VPPALGDCSHQSLQLAMGNVAAATACITDPEGKNIGVALPIALLTPLPVCCEAAMDELEFNCQHNNDAADGAVAVPAPAVQSKWMQGPVIAAFEARLETVERERQAAAALQIKLAAVEREKQAAVAREDYDAAKRCKQAINMLKAVSDAESQTIRGQWGTRLVTPQQSARIQRSSSEIVTVGPEIVPVLSTQQPQGFNTRAATRSTSGLTTKPPREGCSTRSISTRGSFAPTSATTANIHAAMGSRLRTA